jgi:CubicO group peptidase (beta-lactamase class C family)
MLTNERQFAEWFDALRAEHGVVGASLAVYSGGRRLSAASGLLNADTGVTVTPDAVFQIGSISKVFTAVLLLQLQEEGRLDLDEPVAACLPGFAVADPDATRSITVRQLLCHSSGLEGDFFPEDDPFRPPLSAYVERCRLLPQLHAPGAAFSYCNSGYAIAGRIVEHLCGRPWGQVVAQRILEPLAMAPAVTDPAQLPRYRAAVGHLPSPDNPGCLSVVTRPFLPLGLGPAGSVLTLSADALLAFAVAHLAPAAAGSGGGVPGRAAREEMMRPQVAVYPQFPLGVTHWGLGWYLRHWVETPFYGHNGGTVGQYAYLHLFPAQELAIALLTNSGSAALFSRVQREILREHGCGDPEVRAKSRDAPDELAPFTGRYESIAGEVRVSAGCDGLVAALRSRLAPAQTEPLEPIAADTFVTRTAEGGIGHTLHFVGAGTGAPASAVYFGSRMLRRVETGK